MAFNAFPWASVIGQYSTAFGPKPIPPATPASRPWLHFDGLGRRRRTGGEKQEQQRGRRRIGLGQRGTVECGPRRVLDPDGIVDEIAVGGVGDDELACRVFDVARQLRAAARRVHPDDAGAGQRGAEDLEHVLRARSAAARPRAAGGRGRASRAAMRPASPPRRPPPARSRTVPRTPGRRCRRRHVPAPVRPPSVRARFPRSSCGLGPARHFHPHVTSLVSGRRTHGGTPGIHPRF